MSEIIETEIDNILSIYWQMLSKIERETDPEKDSLDKILVEGAYTALNRIGYTIYRPKWE